MSEPLFYSSLSFIACDIHYDGSSDANDYFLIIRILI